MDYRALLFPNAGRYLLSSVLLDVVHFTLASRRSLVYLVIQGGVDSSDTLIRTRPLRLLYELMSFLLSWPKPKTTLLSPGNSVFTPNGPLYDLSRHGRVTKSYLLFATSTSMRPIFWSETRGQGDGRGTKWTQWFWEAPVVVDGGYGGTTNLHFCVYFPEAFEISRNMYLLS